VLRDERRDLRGGVEGESREKRVERRNKEGI
jgi:hypothetical protein